LRFLYLARSMLYGSLSRAETRDRTKAQTEHFWKGLIMRAAIVLVGLLMVTGSALAADGQSNRATGKIVVAAIDVKQAQAAPAPAVRGAVSRSVLTASEGDSRLNDYRLERESSCGPQ
jgi:hypothetical protein